MPTTIVPRNMRYYRSCIELFDLELFDVLNKYQKELDERTKDPLLDCISRRFDMARSALVEEFKSRLKKHPKQSVLEQVAQCIEDLCAIESHKASIGFSEMEGPRTIEEQVVHRMSEKTRNELKYLLEEHLDVSCELVGYLFDHDARFRTIVGDQERHSKWVKRHEDYVKNYFKGTNK